MRWRRRASSRPRRPRTTRRPPSGTAWTCSPSRDDADAAEVNFHLADALYESGDFAHAAEEYERTAYTYAPGPDSAKAAYAALSAYQKQEPLLPKDERAPGMRAASNPACDSRAPSRSIRTAPAC